MVKNKEAMKLQNQNSLNVNRMSSGKDGASKKMRPQTAKTRSTSVGGTLSKIKIKMTETMHTKIHESNYLHLSDNIRPKTTLKLDRLLEQIKKDCYVPPYETKNYLSQQSP